MKIRQVCAGTIFGLVLLSIVPVAASAQTVGMSYSSSSNAQLIALLTQLIQILEQELTQIGGQSSPVPATPPTQCVAMPTATCSGGAWTAATASNGCTTDWQCVMNPAQNAPVSCSFGGQTLQSGTSVIAYQSASVAHGTVCQAETRTCNDGVLSGSYSQASCTVQASAPVSTTSQCVPMPTVSCNGGLWMATAIANGCATNWQCTISSQSTPSSSNAFSASPVSGDSPLMVTFKLPATTPLGDYSDYDVNFGDGTIGELVSPVAIAQCTIGGNCTGSSYTGLEVTHTYTRSAVFTATVFKAGTPVCLPTPTQCTSSNGSTTCTSGTNTCTQTQAQIPLLGNISPLTITVYGKIIPL